MAMGRGIAWALVGALSFGACGSTVVRTDVSPGASSELDPGLELATTGDDAGLNGVSSTRAGRSIAAAGALAGRGVGSGRVRDANPRQDAVAQGITDDSILIGTTDSESADAVLSDAGIVGATQGSGTARANALMDYFNSRGGVAGRKLKNVVYSFKATGTEDQVGAACATFTQDNRVFAVLTPAKASSDDFRACLNKRNTPVG
ncbi:MAG: hypothetical protein ACRDKJ_03700 [Actinomycetota bacterium]